HLRAAGPRGEIRGEPAPPQPHHRQAHGPAQNTAQRMIAWRHVSLSLMLVAATAACQTRVLFIGNSYTHTNDLPGMFTTLAASLGEDVVTGMSAPGGYTFNQHTQNTATLNALAQGDWDVVVLQEQSQLPSFPLGQV